MQLDDGSHGFLGVQAHMISCVVSGQELHAKTDDLRQGNLVLQHLSCVCLAS